MAALDFGMALARGMLPTSEKAQKDLINLAGGRNIFKSEDWWNKQVDKQISEGYREAEQETRYLTEAGYKPRAGTSTTYGRVSYGIFNPIGPDVFGMPYRPSYSIGGGLAGGVSARTSDILPEGVIRKNGQAVSKQFEVFRSDAKRKDYTAGELSDIEASAEAGAARARREAATKTATQRKKRGTGGLAAKAMKVGDKPVTGLPELGAGGLGIGATTLGKGLLV